MAKRITEHTVTFACLNCPNPSPVNLDGIKEHLRLVHGLSILQGKRKTDVFAEGNGCYYQLFTWTLPGGVQVQQTKQGPRAKSNPPA